MADYIIDKYGKSRFGQLLDECSHEGRGYSEGKSHLVYLDEYLIALGAKTIIVEKCYTDRDYLEDFAAYYARCHATYQRHCARFHFFKEDISAAEIDQLLGADAAIAARLKASYLGFIVVKPLPSTIVGRTCLATYGPDRGKRQFVTRQYHAHLFGIELKVESLAFQEQDADVAACATSALWSVFHSTGLKFQRPIPSPAEITKAATAHVRYVDRSLPAMNGLSAEQMGDAIRSVGLEPLQINAEEPLLLKTAARAYMLAKIPCLLLGMLVEDVRGKRENIGLHAVALTGFGVPDSTVPIDPYGKSKTLFAASRITKFYAHDDQIGPFAKMEFNGVTPCELSTSWGHHSGAPGQVTFEPQVLLVPVYHKIRVPVDSAISTLVAFDEWLEMARSSTIFSVADRVEWDLGLTENAPLKEEIFGDSTTNQTLRVAVLRANLPHYMWRATARSGGSKLFEIFFDATDLLQGGQFIGGLSHNKRACVELGAFFSDAGIIAHLRGTGRAIEDAANWFASNRATF